MEAKILKWVARFFFVGMPMILALMIAWLYADGFIVHKWGTGKGFPNENELIYETGYLKSRNDPYSCNKGHCTYYPTTILTKSLNMATGQEYYCHYSYGRKVSCFGEEFPNEYRNQPAKIGYYVQPDFLWYKDNTRQLVTLEVNGKMVIDYQESQERLYNIQNPDYWGFFIVMLVFFALCLSPIIFIWGIVVFLRLISNGSVNDNKKKSS